MKQKECLEKIKNELTEEFFLAAGPGGQNVNKVATAVRLRLHIASSSCLPQDVKERILHNYRTQINNAGELIIENREYRSQLKNREAARAKLFAIIKSFWQAPRKRRKTKPTKASIQRRLESKKKRSQLKQSRNRFKNY